jgi:PilZ domain-containing protein
MELYLSSACGCGIAPMMGLLGGMIEPKCIAARGPRAHAIVRALCDLTGHALVEDDRAALVEPQLLVVDAERISEASGRAGSVPIIAISARRLRATDVESLKHAGASAVLDADSNVLDVAFAASDLLFATCAQRRRYGRTHGGTHVNLALPSGSYPARLLDIGRSGAFLSVDHRIEEGTPIEIDVAMLGEPVTLRGRVAYAAANVESVEDREIAVEFALDDIEVAPKIATLIEVRERRDHAVADKRARLIG